MLTTQTADPTPVVRTNFFDPTNRTAYAVLSEQCGVPASTLCDRQVTVPMEGSRGERKQPSSSTSPFKKKRLAVN
jgi:hypothetical protein